MFMSFLSLAEFVTRGDAIQRVLARLPDDGCHAAIGFFRLRNPGLRGSIQ